MKSCGLQCPISTNNFRKFQWLDLCQWLSHCNAFLDLREIANSGSILTHKVSTPTRHAMDYFPRFLHRLTLLQRWLHVPQLRQVDPAQRVESLPVTRRPVDSNHTN